MLLLTSLVLAGHFQTVTVDVALSADTAVVEATYPRGEASVPSFVLIRLPGLSIEGIEIRGTEVVVHEQPGLIRVSPSGTAHDGLVRLRYTARGRLDRIPLAVPGTPLRPEDQGVRIQIGGLPADARLDRAFPRLALEDAGLAVATLANVPSLVRLPPRQGSLRLSRVMEWLVVLLVLGSSAGWAVRARRRTRA